MVKRILKLGIITLIASSILLTIIYFSGQWNYYKGAVVLDITLNTDGRGINGQYIKGSITNEKIFVKDGFEMKYVLKIIAINSNHVVVQTTEYGREQIITLKYGEKYKYVATAAQDGPHFEYTIKFLDYRN